MVNHKYDAVAVAYTLYVHLLSYVPPDIREDVGKRSHRDRFHEEVHRKHFVSRQDCLNLSRKIHHLSTIRHDNDAQSVHMMVKELREENGDPVLLYKAQGINDQDYPMLGQDSFVLAIQTPFQRELFQSFASTIICIDSTHKTNSHRFKLITLIVPDEYGEGKCYVSVAV